LEDYQMGTKASQVRFSVLEAIKNGGYKVGEKLPTEPELVRQLGVSRTSLREGLSGLVTEGILKRRQGSGTFVTSLKKLGQNKVLATVVPCIRGDRGVYDQIVRGMEDEAHDQGYSLIVCSADNMPEKAMKYISQLASVNVAGVLYAPMILKENYDAANRRVLAEFEKRHIPFVIVDSALSDKSGQFSFVGTNGFDGMRKMVKHLVSLGHRRLACIRYFLGVWSSDQRFEGFANQAHRKGLSLPEHYVCVISASEHAEQGRKEIHDILQCTPRPTAVACTSDICAMNVMNELKRLGLRVPQDMAVTGFDGLSLGAYLHPPLTTVRQPFQEEGRIAVQVLLQKIRGELEGEISRFMDCRLLIRGSCGAKVGRQVPVVAQNAKQHRFAPLETRVGSAV
jgi:DNA-binding LacI/PurR family transcriptional regulator